jgi:hypothetical protein
MCDAGDLLDSVRGQLGIDEARAAEVQRLLGLVSSHMRDQAGEQRLYKNQHPVGMRMWLSLALHICTGAAGTLDSCLLACCCWVVRWLVYDKRVFGVG